MVDQQVVLSQRVGSAFYGSFKELRAAQHLAVAPVLAGLDVLIRAGTGSGKTEAATAPLVERNLAHLDRATGVVLVYISPTRALANDLVRRLEPVFDRLGLSIGVRHSERDDLSRAKVPSVLVTTPESLDVLLSKGDERLRHVRGVVLDEVHLLANTQRGMQLAILVHRLELWIERDLQVVGLSATIAEPLAVWEFFRPGHGVEVVDDTADGRRLISKVRMDLDRVAISRLLSEYASDDATKILVFVGSRRECDLLAVELRESSGFEDHVYAHHSSLERDERLRVESEFERSPRAICVATSTLELGIDIGDINLVVLYGVPSDWQSFLQRVGRGNRRSSEVQALCVVPPAREGASLRLRDELGFQSLLLQVRDGAPDGDAAFEIFGAAAQQLVSIVNGHGGAFVGINRFIEALGPWSHLDPDTVEEMLDELVDAHVLKRHPLHRRYGADDGFHQLLADRQIWSNFPLGSQDIELLHGSASLGRIPASNLFALREGSRIAFGGRRWEVRTIRGGSVNVVPAASGKVVELKYGRTGPPLDPALADCIRRLLRTGAVGRDVNRSTARSLELRFGEMRELAGDEVLPVCNAEGLYVYATFGGVLLNQVVAGWAHGDPTAAGEMTVRSSRAIDFSALPEDPAELVDHLTSIELPDDQATQFQRMLPGALRRRELQNLWVGRRCHRRTLQRLRTAAPVALPLELVAVIDG